MVRQPAAQTGSLDLDGGSLRYTLYAPEWIWQKQNINILMVFESDLDAPATIQTRLGFPSINTHAFDYAGSRSKALALAPGEQGRIVFANILARDRVKWPAGENEEGGNIRTVKVRGDDGEVWVRKERVEKIETGRYVFTLQLEAHSAGASSTASLTYPVTTVRGAAVGEGFWARWLPALLILGWCGLIFLILPRMAKPGAWRLPSEAFEDAETAPASKESG